MTILSEDGAEEGTAATPKTLRHFSEKASVSAFMQPDSRGLAEVDFNQLEEVVQVEKGKLIGTYQGK